MKWPIYLESAKEGGYIANVPAFPGCVAQGETKEEALVMAHDAIHGYLKSLKKHGEPIPKPGEIEYLEVN